MIAFEEILIYALIPVLSILVGGELAYLQKPAEHFVAQYYILQEVLCFL